MKIAYSLAASDAQALDKKSQCDEFRPPRAATHEMQPRPGRAKSQSRTSRGQLKGGQ